MKKKNFTMIEIMIVVAIIAILAAIAVPALAENKKEFEARKRAKENGGWNEAKVTRVEAPKPVKIVDVLNDNGEVRFSVKCTHMKHINGGTMLLLEDGTQQFFRGEFRVKNMKTKTKTEGWE